MTPTGLATRVPLLGALTGLLFAAGLVGLAVVDNGDGDDEVGMTTSTTETTPDTTAPADTTTTAFAVTTSALPGTTMTTATVGGAGQAGGATTTSTTSTTAGAGSGLGAGGSGTVPGSNEMAETGAELLLLPGLAALGLALGARRLRD